MVGAASVLSGGTLVATAPAAAAEARPAAAPAREALETLTAAESDTLEAIVARLIPTDENGPGAAEARAAHYIDRALGGPLASGGTRMGENRETNVVDPWGFAYEASNLGVLGASVMGTSGAHNPTLTAQALAWRTAERLTTAWKTIASA